MCNNESSLHVGRRICWNFRSLLYSLVGTKVPGSESSTPGTFAAGSEWSWERKVLHDINNDQAITFVVFCLSVRLKARSHMTIGMTTGLQTYANYLAAHWLTVYQWS